MIIAATQIKIIRFDIDQGITSVKTKIRWEIGTKTSNGDSYLLVRWYVTAVENDVEILGYLCEKRAAYENKNREDDLQNMIEYLRNIFLNVEMHFDDNPKINNIQFTNIDKLIEKTAEEIIADLYI